MMTYEKPVGWIVRGSWLALALAFAACATSEPPANELVGKTESQLFTNGGFETGAANNPPVSWTVATFLNPNPGGVTIQNPQTRAGLNLTAGGIALTDTIAGVNQPDPDLGLTASFRWSRYGNQCARVNFHGNNNNVNSLAQTMTIGAGDVDPNDGNVHVRFVVAPVLQHPSMHTLNQQPYYFVQLTNITQANAVLYSDFNLSGQPGVPWKTVNAGLANELNYTDWQLVDIAPGSARLAMGDMVKLEVIGGGCSLGGHFGEVYIDGVGPTVPGLFVSGTGPAQANAGTNITYALTYRNGSASAETGVVIDFTTPPNTTFQSFVAPAGAVCVTPTVGTAGTIVCTFASAIAAGATGNFSVTVGINAGAVGQITCGTYDIHSTQETPLLGNKIITEVGCIKDADCSAGNWCKETAPTACSPTLPNGTAIPNDPSHTAPTISGTCTAQVGTLVCTSGVCDTVDNKCGFLNNDGPCTVGNGGSLCRSGVCDTNDGKCGLANGDGMCTVANGGTVCRSGACSTNGTCEPSGGCNVDADCTGGKWCAEATHTCTATIANGGAMPTDGPHTNPTLNGMCTVAAGMLVCTSAVCDTADSKCGFANGDGSCTVNNEGTVCRSGVCDPNDGKCGLANGDGTCTVANGPTLCRSLVCDVNDGKCGYATGDGPCTTQNGATVCRSGVCNTTGTCEPPGGCNVDADCTGGKWCNEGAHMCTAPIANGGAMPTDGPHTNPTLDGTCSVAAGTLVCQSGVCDTHDNKCGYADGDGPCTMSNGGSVCRSGTCSSGGTCVGTAPTDGGAPDSGTPADSGATGDSGGGADGGAGADSGSEPDSGTADTSDASDLGSLAGGGFDCAVASVGASGSVGDSRMLGGSALAGLALLSLRRRRRDASANKSR